jgi:lysophospholipase L1-like esterase
MPAPLPLPMRVLVKGPSTVVWLSDMGGPRTDFTFPRSLEAHLLAAGQPVEVLNTAIASDRAKTTLRNWQREILAYSPDVIILLYGQYETLHFLAPWWLERHANSLRRRPGRIREHYRKRLLGPAWMSLARFQAKVDTRVNSTFWRGRPPRVTAHLERLIERSQLVGSPLVYVFEILPPAKRWQSWFPGMAERTVVMNEAIAGLIDRIDKPNVRLFPMQDLVKRNFADIEEVAPDGGHFTPELHRVIGEALSEEILAWAATQPHLKGPGSALDIDTLNP